MSFKTNFSDVFSDFGVLLCGCCCPYCLSMSNWAEVREEPCGIQHCCFFTSEFWVRQQIRDRIGMKYDCVEDTFLLCCCFSCLTAIDAVEIKYLNQHNIGSKKSRAGSNSLHQTLDTPPNQPFYPPTQQSYPPQQPLYPQQNPYSPQQQYYPPQQQYYTQTNPQIPNNNDKKPEN